MIITSTGSRANREANVNAAIERHGTRHSIRKAARVAGDPGDEEWKILRNAPGYCPVGRIVVHGIEVSDELELVGREAATVRPWARLTA